MTEDADNSFTFVVGGARSGKSSFAMTLAESCAPPRLYVATAQSLDSEMEERIRRHREERGDGWETLEEPMEVPGSVMRAGGGYRVVLIDCLTLWLTNLLMAGLDDPSVLSTVEGLISACRGSSAKVIAVSNEVGLGLVPENPLSRRFRDLSGTMNQKMAAAASEAWFVASGIPLKMK
jgi:adenosylcobinamide kinase/adenosylcobinamide-phosphate guanylyltransferase